MSVCLPHINLMVSVDIKHHVYLLTWCFCSHRKSGETLLLHVNRPQSTPEPREPSEPLQSSERLEPSVWRRPDPIYESIPEEVTQEGTEFADNDKENEISMDTHFEMSSVYQPFTQAKLSASTPLPSQDAKHVVSGVCFVPSFFFSPFFLYNLLTVPAHSPPPPPPPIITFNLVRPQDLHKYVHAGNDCLIPGW